MEMTQTQEEVVPVVTLSNGLRVANFSSPHAFTFVDGSVLPACSKERALRLMLDAHEHEEPGIKGTTDIVLEWAMSLAVKQELAALQARSDIDVIIVPLPVMTVMKDGKMPIGKCRVIRVADRVSKAVHVDRFCR
jgi:hypothetical protein